jgi:putative membrane protein
MLKNIAIVAALLTGMAPIASAQLSPADKTFVMKLAKSNNYELKAAQMAQDMSTNDAYKTYGQMIVTDHTQAGQDLASAVSAADPSMQLPTGVSATDQAHLDTLKNAGKSFDVKYRMQMISTHQAALALVKTYLQHPDDNAGIKTFAKNLPTVFEKHWGEAKKLPRQ